MCSASSLNRLGAHIGPSTVREAARTVRSSHVFLAMATGIVSIAMQTIVPATRQTRPRRRLLRARVGPSRINSWAVRLVAFLRFVDDHRVLRSGSEPSRVTPGVTASAPRRTGSGLEMIWS